MDINLLYNLERILIQTRLQMDSHKKQLFIHLLSCFTWKSSNKAFYSMCKKSGCCYNYLLNSNGKIVDIDGYTKEILLIEQCLIDIIYAIRSEKFNMAEDIADAFHFIPHIIAEQQLLDMIDFKKTMGYPLEEKWQLCYSM